MKYERVELYRLAWTKMECLKAVDGVVFRVFEHYSSQTGTSLLQGLQRALRMQKSVQDLNTSLLALFLMALLSLVSYNERMVNQLHDCMRLFAGLEHMDFERALWNYITSPQTCDRTFKRFAEFSSLLSSLHRETLNPCECHFCTENDFYSRRGCMIEALGSAMWQISCHIPRNLSPSPPPPPYTLYDFNIELPPIRYRAETTRHSSVGEILRLGKRRRSDSEDVDTILRPSMRRICDTEDIEEIRPDRDTGPEWQEIKDEDEHPAKRRLLNEAENVEYIRKQRLLRFQGAA